MQIQPPDFLSFTVAVLALIVGNEVAYLVGPYAAIIALAFAGASLSLSSARRHRPLPLGNCVVYVSVRVLVAVVLTVALAEVFEYIFPSTRAQYIVIPLAFCIGWIADYRQVKAWLLRLFDRLVDKKQT
jgi:hypothetical protein